MTNKQIIEILLSIQKDTKETKERLTNLEDDVKDLKDDMCQVKVGLTHLENKFDNHMNKYHPESL